MTNGEVCTAVNALFRAVCELKLNSDKNTLKSQMQFLTDFHTNRRALVNSFVLYEYYTNDELSISKDELDLMREFLLTYLEKYEDSNVNNVIIGYSNKTLKFVFNSYERASKTNDTSTIIKSIELDIAKLYENSIFKIIDQITASLPQDPIIVQIRNIQKFFKSGNLTSRYNENILGNYVELERYVLSITLPTLKPMYIENCNYSPFEPFSPFEPSEPSEPSSFITFEYFSNKIGNISDDLHNLHEGNIKAAISKILEITTTEELTQV